MPISPMIFEGLAASIGEKIFKMLALAPDKRELVSIVNFQVRELARLAGVSAERAAQLLGAIYKQEAGKLGVSTEQLAEVLGKVPTKTLGLEETGGVLDTVKNFVLDMLFPGEKVVPPSAMEGVVATAAAVSLPELAALIGIGAVLSYIGGTAVEILHRAPAEDFAAQKQNELRKLLEEPVLPVAAAAAAAGKPAPAAAAGAPKKMETQKLTVVAVPFVARETDLIDSMDELRSAVANNEAPFLASLPGRLIRDVKIVSSITARDGTVQHGKTQQVVVGKKKNGEPKYRIVRNKYAVADIFVLSDKGTRVKIARIVYGPTNATTFNPHTGALAGLVSEVKAAAAPAAPVIVAPAAPATMPRVKITPRDYFREDSDFYTAIFYRAGNALVQSPELRSVIPESERAAIGNVGAQTAEAIRRLDQAGYGISSIRRKQFVYEIDGRVAPISQASSFDNFFGARAETPVPAQGLTPAPAYTAATTLSEFYTLQGLELPPVSARALIYEQQGLGPANFYTGTAEQNTKLLAALQRRG